MNRTVAEPPVLAAGLLHRRRVGDRRPRVDRDLVVVGPLEDHRAARRPRRHGRPDPADVARRRQVGVAFAGRMPSAPGPHCSYAWAMFLPVSSAGDRSRDPREVERDLVVELQIDAGRLAGRRGELRANADAQPDGSSAAPIGAATAVDRIVPQESLPAVAVGGTGRHHRRRRGGARREGDQAHPEGRGRSQKARRHVS